MKSFETSSVYDFLWSKDELEKKEVKSKVFTVKQYVVSRAVGRSENPGVPVLFGGHNLPPLIEIGLTDLTKSGGDMATPVPGIPRDDTPAMYFHQLMFSNGK